MGHKDLEHYVGEAFRRIDEGLTHPSIDQLTELARGKSFGADRQELVTHLAACEMCQERYQEFEAFLADCERPASQELSDEWRSMQRRLWWRRSILALPGWLGSPSALARRAAVVAGVVVLAGAVWFGVRILSPSPARLLAQAYHDRRTSEFRLANAPYGPIRIERGAGSVFSMPEPLLKASARLAAELKSSPEDPELLRMQAEAEMMQHEPGAAVHTLQKALDFSPQNARVLADLGAAYAMRGDLERQPVDYPNALEYFSRSLHIQPRTTEVIFNRALVLEKMQLKDQAALEWERYLKIDGKSGWAKEARKHLADLKAVMKSREDRLRRVVDDPAKFLAMTGSYKGFDAEAYLRDIAVTKWLPRAASDARVKQAVVQLGQILKERNGDSWLADVSAGIGRPGMQAGFERLAAARIGNQSAHAEAALVAAREAEEIFGRAGTKPGVLWGRFEEAFGLRVLLQSDQCLKAGEGLIAELDQHPYIWLRAQSRIETAYCAMRIGRMHDATPNIRAAISLSRTAGFGDAGLRAGAGYLDDVSFIGMPSEIYTTADDFLRSFWNGAYPAVRYQQFIEMLRDIANRSDQKYVAWFLARSAVWAADSSSNPRVAGPAHANLAVASQNVGEDKEANANLEIADKTYVGLPAGYRLRPQASLATVELKRGDSDAALKRLEKLRPTVDPSPLTASQFYQVLGETYRHKQRLSEAITAYRTSIDFGKRTIVSLASEREKAGALKTIENSYRGLVAVTLATSNDPAAGLDVWQSFRALDTVGDHGPVTSPSVPVLWFAELPDGWAGWLARKDRIILHRLSVSTSSLGATITRFRRECSDPSIPERALQQDARQIYQWVVEPFSSELGKQNRDLIFELDGVLAGTPVQALMSPNGHYLSERFSVLVSSGFTSKRNGSPTAPGVSVLVVANPAVTGESAARFPTLPNALKEAEIIRANFAGTTVLDGPRATAEALTRLLPTADIFHFAGHGYSDSDNGALLFAPKDSRNDDYELLRSSELSRQDWSRCELVVLSACATAAGEIQGAHNPDSLVRALSKAGAARIAASLWNVESGVTTELMAAFYGNLAKGAQPAEALREAQRRIRERSEWSHPYYWAGFQLFGTT